MTDELLLPFGQAEDGRIVAVDSVPQGLACNCVCPECGVSLVAAKGDVYRHHFRHAADPCANGGETAIHKFAKQAICEALDVALPPSSLVDDHKLGNMRWAVKEFNLDGVLPDVLAQFENEQLAIEIWVAHQSTDDKVSKYNERRVAAIEIDLRGYRHADYPEDHWRALIVNHAPRAWLSPSAAMRARQEEIKQQHLRELSEKAEAEQARAAMLLERQQRLEMLQKRTDSINLVRNQEFARRRHEREQRLAEQSLRGTGAELEQNWSDNAEQLKFEEEFQRLQAEREERERERERLQAERDQLEAERAAAELERQRLQRLKRQAEAQRLDDQIAQQVIKQRRRDALIAEMSPPSLQQLVRDHGGYQNITPEAWKDFGQRKRTWEERRLNGDFHREPYLSLRQKAGENMDEMWLARLRAWADQQAKTAE